MSNPLFTKSTPVQVRATKELGFVIDDPVMSSGEYWYRVRFQARVGKYPEEALEPPVSLEDTIRDLAVSGNWGTLRAFRASVTLDRLRHTDPGTLHSYRAQRIRFEAHQYKPLLKFLDSPDRRLLIADEVGMGKTIEAGLILSELESRKAPERVLVVCPSRLMEKWRDELSRKFEMEFSLFRRRDMDEYLAQARRRGVGGRLRAIASMQTLRDPELRERMRVELDSIDLLVVDEAHHARNPQAQTSQLLSELCEFADGVLLLTATPLHLGSRDLFTLLQALRPAEYRSDKAFAVQVNRYRQLHEAAPLLRTGIPRNVQAARKIVAELFTDPKSNSVANPLAADLLSEIDTAKVRDGRDWVELERRLQALHPLASIVTRSRKRDAYERIAVRKPFVWRCQWTDEEKEACRRLLEGADELGWFDHEMTLVQIQRARQAASCLPAALRSDWAIEAVEDDPDDDEANAPRASRVTGLW